MTWTPDLDSAIDQRLRVLHCILCICHGKERDDNKTYRKTQEPNTEKVQAASSSIHMEPRLWSCLITRESGKGDRVICPEKRWTW